MQCSKCGNDMTGIPEHLKDLASWVCKKCTNTTPKPVNFYNPFDSPDSRAGVGERRCTECKEVFPFDDEHFSKTEKGNLRKVCISCHEKKKASGWKPGRGEEMTLEPTPESWEYGSVRI